MVVKVCESIGIFGPALAVAGGVVNSALRSVHAGHRVVISDPFRGVQDILVGEGTHCLILWARKPVIFDCRSRSCNVQVITGSKDLQNSNITLGLPFQLVTSPLPRILTSIGELLPPSITTELKSMVARFHARELTTQRELASRQVSGSFTTRAVTLGLILDNVSSTHLTFGKFAETMEANQVAQQEAERARFMVEKAQRQQKVAIISAVGNSKAAELMANSAGTADDDLIAQAAEARSHRAQRMQTVSLTRQHLLQAGQSVLLQLPQ